MSIDIKSLKEGDECECGGKLIVELTPLKQHYGKLICERCKRYIKWIPTPNESGVRKGTSKYNLDDVCSFYRIKKPFCFFCQRKQEELGFSETLTRDHILELNADGKDELNNIQILCTACHKLKLWNITYVKNHLAERLNQQK